MGRQQSLRSKAVHLVSDITTVLFNPISDKPSKPTSDQPSSLSEDAVETERSQTGSVPNEEGSEAPTDGGPDTSSFTAFLASFLSSPESKNDPEAVKDEPESDSKPENLGRKKNQGSENNRNNGYELNNGGDDENNFRVCESGERVKNSEDKEDEGLPAVELPEMSEPSLLLSERTRRFVYDSLPALAKGRKWVLLYSTWRHGISLSTLYRRSMFCNGFSLLVVGDRKGAVFGGLVEAPLKPSKSRKYQGTNSTFLFTDMPGRLCVYRPTGTNQYYTLCSPDFLALGGGDHFALYLDSDLLNGSSTASETYGNSCLAHSQDFAVKEVEVWGFVYASKYEETLALCRAEAPPGICRW